MADVFASFQMDAVGAALYVPFRGANPETGPVASLEVDGSVTGDAAGGIATVQFNGMKGMFGFEGLYVPRMINTVDDQAAATRVLLRFLAIGNSRLRQDMALVDEKNFQVGSSNFNAWRHHDYRVLIEPITTASLGVMNFVWAANVDTKVYQAQVFFLVYDMQALVRNARWSIPQEMLN